MVPDNLVILVVICWVDTWCIHLVIISVWSGMETVAYIHDIFARYPVALPTSKGRQTPTITAKRWHDWQVKVKSFTYADWRIENKIVGHCSVSGDKNTFYSIHKHYVFRSWLYFLCNSNIMFILITIILCNFMLGCQIMRWSFNHNLFKFRTFFVY